jgi:hypothetical protein
MQQRGKLKNTVSLHRQSLPGPDGRWLGKKVKKRFD